LTDTVACRTVYISDVPYPRKVRRFHAASVVDPHRFQCGSGSSIFGSMCGSGSRFLITQICIYIKICSWKKILSKIAIFIPRLGLHEGRQATEEAFRIKIEHPTLQNMKFLYFSLFVAHLCLPGSEIGSSGTKSMRIHDPHTACIQPLQV
jgi:hypothetical protein